jgi:5'-3' exonuclease
MTSRLMLLDSASMYYRAYYGVPDSFRADDGTPVNAVRGFLDAVAAMIGRFQPTDLVACWDDDWRPQFRVDLVPSYKAHRVADSGSTNEPDVDPESSAPGANSASQKAAEEEIPDDLEVQVPIMMALLAALGITRVGAGGFEADDVIAQYVRRYHGPVDIVTGDRDLFQLVDPAGPTRVVYTASGFAKPHLVDDQWLLAKYQVTGAQYADFSLMRGDSSDGLPGVVGVGEKTAASLLDRFGNLTQIVAAATDPASDITPGLRRKLLDSRDYLQRADPVVRLNHEVPIPNNRPILPISPHDPQKLNELADSYNLRTPMNRLISALGWD